MKPRRLVGLAAVALAALGLGIADRTDRASTVTPITYRTAPGPRIPGAGTEEASWFCPFAGGVAGGPVTEEMAFLNTAGAPRAGTMTLVGLSGAPKVVAYTVPAHTVQVANVVGVAGSQVAAAAVTMDGGGLALYMIEKAAAGWTGSPCARAPSAHWYFPSGSTTYGDELALCLYNPGATDAVVDVELAEAGRAEVGTRGAPAQAAAGTISAPPPLQGIVVPPGSASVVQVVPAAPDLASIATEVSAMQGAVVASEYALRSEPGAAGISIVTGAPSPVDTWFLPAGYDGAGLDESLGMLDPGGTAADVTIAPLLPGASSSALATAVAAGGFAELPLNGVGSVPDTGPHGLVVRSRAAGVVIGHVESGGMAGGAHGRADVLGLTATARTWALVGGLPWLPATGWLTVLDPGRRAAAVHIVYQGPSGPVPPPAGLPSFVDVPAGGIVQIPLHGPPAVPLSLTLVSSVPVAAESDLDVTAVGGGIVSLPGIPGG